METLSIPMQYTEIMGKVQTLKEPKILKRILSFRAPEIPKRIAQKANISIGEAEKLFTETLKYLYICRQARKIKIPISPSIVIDDSWHNFILFTKKYAQFCEEYVVEFIHYIPDTGNSNPERYIISRNIAQSLLEYLYPAIWPEISVSADCSVCQSIPPCSECQPPCSSDDN